MSAQFAECNPLHDKSTGNLPSYLGLKRIPEACDNLLGNADRFVVSVEIGERDSLFDERLSLLSALRHDFGIITTRHYLLDRMSTDGVGTHPVHIGAHEALP